jgi:outer membrane lipoprotein-sorting protein
MPPLWLKNKMVVVFHLTLLLVTFFLFPVLKWDLKGRRFADIAEDQSELLAGLESISIGFRQCFQWWE